MSKAVGPDGIPNWLLRDLAHIIASTINAIHTSFIREGYVPDLWQRVDVFPLPKTTIVSDIKKDTRPISLTPVLSKCLKYHPVEHTRQACPNIDSSQYGSVRKSSTTHVLLCIKQSITVQILQDSFWSTLVIHLTTSTMQPFWIK